MDLVDSRLAASLLGILLTAPALAFEGVVLDAAGRPIAGARVSVAGEPGSVVTDAAGRFVLEPAPEPPFELIVSAGGVAFPPVVVSELPAGRRIEVVVASPFSAVVDVISGAVPDLEMAPAAAATILGRGELDKRRPQTVSDVVAAIPGAAVAGEGRSAVPSLRGMARARTLILLDEGRVTSERRAGPSASFLDPLTAEEVEVIRGPGAVAYGSDAFGGVIRARTRLPAPGDPCRLRADLAGGSADDQLAGAVEVSGSALGGAVLAGAHLADAGDYGSREGEIDNSGWRSRGSRAGYARVLGQGVLQAIWRSDEVLAAGKPSPEPSDRTSYPLERSHRLSVAYERAGSGAWTRLAVSGAWDSYRLVTERERDATGPAPATATTADVEAQDYELRAEAERSVGRSRLVLGAHAYGRLGLRAINESFAPGDPGRLIAEVAIGDARRDDTGVFAALTVPAGRLSLQAGARLDAVSSSTTGGYFGSRGSSDTAISGFAAASFAASPALEVTAQLASGFRDPLLSDRYYRGISGRGFITGNPDLDPETSRQLDLAVHFRTGDFRLSGYAYLYRIRGLIERYRSGPSFFFRNRGEAEVVGAELEATWRLTPSLELSAGAQALRGEVRDDGSPTDDVPPTGATLTLRGAPGPAVWWRLHAAAYVRDDRPGPGELVTPGYALMDAGAGWRIARALELELVARNVLDRAYPGSADELAVTAPGRSFTLAVRYRS